MKFKSFLLSVFLLASFNTFACQFDTDCQPGSTCIKSGHNIYGFCAGGLNPGNSNDRQPARAIPDITGKKGNTCQFDTDCGPGGNCVKGSGIYGVCL